MEYNESGEVQLQNKIKSSERALSESSSSSDEHDVSNESGTEGDSGPPKKRARRVSDLKLEFLAQQVTFLTSLITQSQVSGFKADDKSEPSSSAMPGVKNMYSVDELDLQPAPGTSTEKSQLNIPECTVVVKDPLYPVSDEKRLKILGALQRFNSKEWHSIRFAEAQKKYLSTPGFVELNINEEIKRFESPNNEDYRLYLLERSFAAMTNAILIQKEELRNNLQQLINWSGQKDTELTASSLFSKVEQLFDKNSAIMKVSDDILQIVCGRRADFVRLRRDSLLKQISDEYISAGLEKIPPSTEDLFDSNTLCNYLQKIGGVDKLAFRQNFSKAPSMRNAAVLGAGRGDPSSSDSYRRMAPASDQSKDKSFRFHGSQKKGKTNKSKGNKNRGSFQKSKQFKDKPPRSRSPAKDRNRRA
jgi:hypothetical protein